MDSPTLPEDSPGGLQDGFFYFFSGGYLEMGAPEEGYILFIKYFTSLSDYHTIRNETRILEIINASKMSGRK